MSTIPAANVVAVSDTTTTTTAAAATFSSESGNNALKISRPRTDLPVSILPRTAESAASTCLFGTTGYIRATDADICKGCVRAVSK